MKRIAAIVAVLSLFALPACGKKSSGLGNSAAVVPASVTAYFSIVNPYDLSEDKQQDALETVKAFNPDESATSFEDLLNKTLSEDESESPEAPDINYKADVEPWLGNEISGASIQFKTVAEDVQEPATVLILPSKDNDKTKTFISKYNVSNSAAKLIGDYVYAVDGTEVCGACGKKAAHNEAVRAINEFESLTKKSPLKDSENYKKQIGAVSSGNEVIAYFDVRNNALEGSDGDFGLGGGADNQEKLLACLGAKSKVGSGLTGAIGVGLGDKEVNFDAASLRGTGGDATNLEIVQGLPTTTAVALSYNGFFSVLNKFTTCYKSAIPEFRQSLVRYKDQLGVDLQTGLIGLLAGETVLAADGSAASPRIGLVTAISNSSLLRSNLKKVIDELKLQGLAGVSEISTGIYEVEGEEPPYVFGIQNGRFAYATSRSYFDTLTKASGVKLGGTESYKKVISGGKASMVFYFNGAQYVKLTEESDSPVGDKDSAKRINVFGGKGSPDGDLTKASFKLFLN